MRTALFNIAEVEVAKRLGLTRENMRDLRVEHLYQDEDWAKIGREIHYSEDGIEKLRQILKKNAPDGVKLGDIAILSTKVAPPFAQGVSGGRPEAPDAPGVILDAVVTKIYQKNPQFLEALLGGQPITVRVNNNANFLPGMVIQSRQLAMKNPRLFDFIGRCPRVRGRW